MMSQRRRFLQDLFLGATGWTLSQLHQSVDRYLESSVLEYSLSKDLVYLNHASIGTCPVAVQDAYIGYLRHCETNPARYIWGDEWKEAREQVRDRLASFLGAESKEIAITHNTTEGFNILSNGLGLGKGDEVLFSNLNHAGASQCFIRQSQWDGYEVKQLKWDLNEVIRWDAATLVNKYLEGVTDRTRLLVIPHIDNMVGYVHPIQQIARAARDQGVDYIAVDGAQSIGMFPVSLNELEADFYCGSPHKWLQTPKGLGVFYCSSRWIEKVRPMWQTWGQGMWADRAQRFEDYGTRDLPTVLALGHAITAHQQIGWEERLKHYAELRNYAQESVPHSAWFSSNHDRHCVLFSVWVGPEKIKEVAMKLDQSGIVVRPFAEGFVRISPNTLNSREDIVDCLKILNGYWS